MGGWLPSRAVDGRSTVIVLHVLAGRATVRSCAAAAGLSVNATHKRLRRLRAAGLVRWDDGRDGTLRPGVFVVPSKIPATTT